jgi:cell division protein FtsL
MIGFLFLAVMALIYIAQSTEGATKQVESQSLRTKTEELKIEEEQLKLEAERLRASEIISKSAQELGLEPASKVEYPQDSHE